jgi:hypothetical protein
MTSERYTPEQLREMADYPYDMTAGQQLYVRKMLRYAADQLAAQSAPPTPCHHCDEGAIGAPCWWCGRIRAQAGGDPPPTTTGSKAWCYAHGAWCWTHPVERKNILCRFDIPAPPQKGETP